MARLFVSALAMTAALFVLPHHCSAELLYSTYIGHMFSDGAADATFDSEGNIVVTGHTILADFPTTPGAYYTNRNGHSDIFVVRLDAELNELISCTVFGGSSDESSRDVLFDCEGRCLLLGRTLSADFPTTPGAWDTSFNGEADIYFAGLSPGFDELLYSSFYGGSDGDHVRGAELHPTGDLFIAGSTLSPDFPVTSGAYSPTHGGGYDIFVSRLSLEDGFPVASTYVGGDSWEMATALAITSQEDVVVVGRSYGWFPTTSGAYQTTYHGNQDIVIFRMKPDLASLGASTYLGGSDLEMSSTAIVEDPQGNFILSGRTDSADFPVTAGAWDTEYSGHTDSFIARLTPRLDALLAATYSAPENVFAGIRDLRVSPAGEIVAVGFAQHLSYPTFRDARILTLPLSLETVCSVNLLGGGGIDTAEAMLIDDSGRVVVVGETNSIDFPTTPGAFDTTLNSPYGFFVDYDAFVSVITPEGYDTFYTSLSCYPNVLELPQECLITAQVGNASHHLRHIDVGLSLRLPDGSVFENFRFTSFVFEEGEMQWNRWNQHFPPLPQLAGTTTYILRAVDVTPAPWNQPPYPPSGSSDISQVPIEITLP